MNIRKKVAIFNSEIMWSPHIGTGLEIMQRHLDEGDEVIAFVYNAFFKHCDQNLNGNPDTCKICVKKRSKSFSWLTESVREIPIEFDKKDFGYVSSEMSLKTFMEIKHDVFDVGMAQQDLDSAQVARNFVDERCFRAAHRMGAVFFNV